jgi:hypothetical protein
VCRFHVAAGEKQCADKQLIWRPYPECRKASKHHLLKFGFLLLVRLNLGFITEGRLAVVLITPSLGVPNWSVIYINTTPSWRSTPSPAEGGAAEVYSISGRGRRGGGLLKLRACPPNPWRRSQMPQVHHHALRLLLSL